MNILILGNGFDIAHELPTKYNDFLEYCIKKYSIDKTSRYIEKAESFTNNLWLRHFISIQPEGDKWIDLENEIYNVIKNLNKSLQSITNNYKTTDFYYEYIYSKNQIEKDYNLRNIISKFQKIEILGEYGELQIKQYIHNPQVYRFTSYKELIQLLYEHLREFTKEFDKYLLDEITPKIGNKKFNYSLLKSSSVRVLNFNYTNTYEQLYSPHSIYADSNPKFAYIHGKICASEDCNLVLGAHSFFNKKPNVLDEEINVEFNIFKKHNQRHRYSTIESYQTLLKELGDKRKIIVPNFHIIGHSLDKTDHSILKHILQVRERSVINVYYHNQDALERMINNITEIIGEEEVMSKVRFIDQHDPKLGILIPIKD